MDPVHQEAAEMIKPYEQQILQLEESDRLKSAQITALQLAIAQLKQQANEHKRKYDEQQKLEDKQKLKKK